MLHGYIVTLLSKMYDYRVPKVTFTQADESVKTVDGTDGQTLLQIALDHDVQMEHACGGSGFCMTCVCKVKDGQKALDAGAISPVNEKEKNMGIEGPDERLGCQVQVFSDVEVMIGDG